MAKEEEKAEKWEKDVEAKANDWADRHGKHCRHHHYRHHAGNGAVYGLGFVGALIYYLQHSSSFVDGLIGILKAIVWPAMLIYQVLINLKM